MCSFGSSNLENMGSGRVASTQSHKKKSSLLKVQILIVDDDATSLAIVSSMLKKCCLQDRLVELSVVTVKNPLDALSTLRTKNGAFDLVLTDLHMPGMNGLELQKQIDEEFKIPVIIISSDDKSSVILKSLESGAIFYIVKPVKQQDLKNVWQYALSNRKSKSVVTEEEMGNNDDEASSSNQKNPCQDVNEESTDNKKKKGKKRVRDGQDEDAPTAPKKAKVVWTNSLHNRFLQAINHIGLDKAVPKRILEFMNVPGLTRENVASHLQKYRMFLKKVAERGLWSSQTLSERALRSSFASGYSPMFFKNGHQDYLQFSGLQHLRSTTFQPGYGANFYGLGTSNFIFPRYSNQEAATNNSVPQFRFGQSSLFGNNSSNFQHRPMFGNTSSLYQPNRTSSGLTPNSTTGLNISANAATYSLMNDTTNGLSNGTSSMPMSQQQNQAISSTPPPFFQFGSNGTGSSSYNSGISNIGTSNCSLNPNSNYAGIRLTSEGSLIGSRHVRLNGNELSSTGLNGGYGSGSMNWNRNNNNNLNSALTGNGIFGYVRHPGGSSSSSSSLTSNYLAQGASSSTGLGSANTFAPAFAAGSNQDNTSVLPPISEQHTNSNPGDAREENDLSFNLMNDTSIFDSISDIQQVLGDIDLSELLFGSTNTTTPSQEQGAEEVLTNLPSIATDDEVNNLLNAEFSSSCTISDKAPRMEQSSSQVQGTDETNNTSGANVTSAHENNYYPSFEQLPDSNNGETNDSDLNENTALEDQIWGDDFLDFLLGNEPY